MKQLALLAGLMLLMLSLVPSPGFCQNPVAMQAKIWSYESVCSFDDPPNSADYDIKATSDKVTLEVTDCKTFEKKNPHPSAVRVSLKNNGTAPAEVAVEKDLAGVELATQSSAAVPAIAKRFMMEGPMGDKKMEYVTRIEASYVITLKPGQEINIVYFFPKAAPGDRIRVGTLKPIKIE